MFSPTDIYDDTITLINRLDAKDATLRQDAYFATVLKGCQFLTQSTQGTDNDGVVKPSTIHRVQIPSDAGDYVPYKDWRKLEVREGSYTLRNGDFIVRGEVTEPVTTSNIRTIVADYEPDAFQVTSWQELTRPNLNGREVCDFYRFSLEG